MRMRLHGLALFWLCASSCASESARPVSSIPREARAIGTPIQTALRSVEFTFRAPANTVYTFVRSPSFDIANWEGTRLGGCTLASFEATCSLTVPYARTYSIRVADATNIDRESVFRVLAPPTLSKVEVESRHVQDAVVLWWSEIAVTLDTQERAENLEVWSEGPMGLHVHNRSSEEVSVHGPPRFLRRQGSVWLPVESTPLSCGVRSRESRGGIRVAPGAEEHIEQTVLGYSFPDDGVPPGPYRVELNVTVVYTEGIDVSRDESHEKVPSPDLYERRIWARELHSLEGWMW